MIDFPSVRRLLTAVVISFALCSIAHADQERAWQALHDLEIAEAKELFQQELTKSPKDLSVMRGLLLAALGLGLGLGPGLGRSPPSVPGSRIRTRRR